MRTYTTNAADIETFLEAKSGSVHAKVYGPRIGYRWVRIKMWRWEKDQVSGEWKEITTWRDTDWEHVQRLGRKIDKVMLKLNARDSLA